MPTVVLGVSASIAAYKAADLASQLVKAGIDVRPILTADAARFVAPATFRALTGHPCPIDVFEEPYPGEIAHIHLAKTADVFAIVPASMTVMAKLANGIGDDMLTASVMATRAPVLFAPGMNSAMWQNPATQANLQKLQSYGYYFIEPVTGRLACRTEGVGKMADVQTILAAIYDLLGRRQDAQGKRVLVTAGPTREPIDPVRFLSNRSSGKMGYALAEVAARRGADVTLVSGPVSLPDPSGVRVVRVETAAQMRDAALDTLSDRDYVFAAAAVADYRPARVHDAKIKKENGPPELLLEPTEDILAEISRRRQPHQIIVGFAAETDDLLENARKKLTGKNLDWVVANDVTRDGAGFDGNTNIVTLLSKEGGIADLPLLTKRETAEKILDAVFSANPIPLLSEGEVR
jgi:phosphopantothenoylcysteine decarboxylase/phosphopantothenate--cysteine ligase